jgi:hypothetical protein
MLKSLIKKINISILLFIYPVISWGGVKTDVETPLDTDITDIPTLIKVILKTILNLAIPIIVLAIVYVGFLFIKAQGNDSELSKAKQALVFVLIGTAVVIAANAAYNIFFSQL